MSSATKLATFDIRNFTDRLQPSSEKGKSICPACGKGNFSISKELNEAGVPSYTCWNGCTRGDIKEVLSPVKEAIAEAQRQQGNSARRTKGKSYKPRPNDPKPGTTALKDYSGTAG